MCWMEETRAAGLKAKHRMEKLIQSASVCFQCGYKGTLLSVEGIFDHSTMDLSDWDAETLVGAVCLAQSLENRRKRKRKRIVWSKNWLLQRDRYSDVSLLNELRVNNPEDFRNYLRMSDANFQCLLEKVSPYIAKQDTRMRQAITPEERLAVTLRFLATGRTYEDLKFSMAISAQALGRIIPETCQAIIDVLVRDYMRLPNTPEEWNLVATQFQDLWQFPNCGGALDGKHVRIAAPAKSGSMYYNYKGFFSIILMAVANAKYEFVMVDVGKPGRMSDGGVLERTVFGRRLKDKLLRLPNNDQTVHGLNFNFVADEAFALGENMLRPFPFRGLTEQRKIFNYRLSRARRVVENAFGIMAQRFRIFHTCMNVAPAKVEKIVFACCLLHNFLRRNNAAGYMPPQSVDFEDLNTGVIIPGAWRSEPSALADIPPSAPVRTCASLQENRDQYVRYFMGDGAVTWQAAMIV
ncbi:putative nuclease HARBI1 [Hyperolius riggenbachi]|uniref:putative nuclease HARBI1 n=1 Tax=Hyperolius riggenbachi TaxID=752182 RepID=UPI0035A2B9F4